MQIPFGCHSPTEFFHVAEIDWWSMMFASQWNYHARLFFVLSHACFKKVRICIILVKDMFKSGKRLPNIW